GTRDGLNDAGTFLDVVQDPLLAVAPFHQAEGAVPVGVVLDFVPSTVLLLGALPAGNAPVHSPALLVCVLRQPPAHHKEGRLHPLPVQQIEQTGRRDPRSRLPAQQHVRLGAVVERKRNELAVLCRGRQPWMKSGRACPERSERDARAASSERQAERANITAWGMQHDLTLESLKNSFSGPRKGAI